MDDKTIKISPETHKRIQRLAKREKRNLKLMVEYLVDVYERLTRK